MKNKNHLKLSITGTLLILGSLQSYAGCTTTNGNDYTCSGVTTNFQNPTGSPLTVNVDPTFQSTTASGAIFAVNSGGFATDVKIAGNVTTTTSSYGIQIRNDGSSNVLKVSQTAGSITTGGTSLIVENRAHGTTDVTTAGDNISKFANGVAITNEKLSSDLIFTQTAGTITGGTNGINSLNDGTGSTNITVAGVVTGGTGVGINTSDRDTISSTTDNFATVTLNSGAVVSAISGIAIQNDEGDSLTTVNDGATVQGKVISGDGNDNLVINGTANISGATLLDGGDAANSVDDLLGSTAYTNKLTFNGQHKV